MRIQEAMGVGMSGETAKAVAGSCAESFTATGTASSDAAVLAAVNVLVTAGANNTGVRVPSDAQIGDCYRVGVGTGNAVIVYPHTGGKINNGSADAGKTVTNGKGIVLTRVGPTQWIATVE